jgi:lactate permease
LLSWYSCWRCAGEAVKPALRVGSRHSSRHAVFWRRSALDRLLAGKGDPAISLDVLYIIWTALLLFHIADEAGAIAVIGRALAAFDRRPHHAGAAAGVVVCLVLARYGWLWCAGGGSGALLVGLGFNPVYAVIMACIGHGWAVNFGSMATSFPDTAGRNRFTGRSARTRIGNSPWVSQRCPVVIVAYVAGSWKGVLRTLPVLLTLSVVMGTVQYLLVTNGIWTLGATGGAMAGLLVGVGLTRIPFYNHGASQTVDEEKVQAALETAPIVAKGSSLPVAFSAYIVLIVLAFGLNLIQPVVSFLDAVSVHAAFSRAGHRVRLGDPR